MTTLKSARDAVMLDTRVARLRSVLQDRATLNKTLYKEAQAAVEENPYLQAVLDAHDMSFTDKLITKNKQKLALQTLLQNLQDQLPPTETMYDQTLIKAELHRMKNSRL